MIEKGIRALSSPTHLFQKAFEEYFEALIELKGHAWCMDVKDERRKMARLATGVVRTAIVLKSPEPILSSDEVFVRCKCRNGAVMKYLGGQYKNSYAGRCSCGRAWFLRDLPARLTFDE